MDPYLFKIGAFELRYYSLMYIIALVLTLYFVSKRIKSLGFEKKYFENMIIIVFIASLFGSRAYYVLFQWDFYKDNPMEIFKVWHGGLAIHGGVIGGFIASLIYSYIIKIRVLLFGDLIAPWLLFGQGIGRFGNFTNGEAHGVPIITPPDIIFRLKPAFVDFWNQVLSKFGLRNTPEDMNKLNEIVNQGGANVEYAGKVYELKEYYPWGISFGNRPDTAVYHDFGSLPVHPTFFYEMILNIIGAIILFFFWRKNKYISTGIVFGFYLIFYGVIRAFVTLFRADDLMLGFLRAPHVASLGFVLIGIALLIYGFRRIKKEKTEELALSSEK